MDASIKPDAQMFSAGLIFLDHHGSFIVGKKSCFHIVSTVFEAEALAQQEDIRWLLDMAYQEGVH